MSNRKYLEYRTYTKTVHASLVVIPRSSFPGLNFRGDVEAGANFYISVNEVQDFEDVGPYPKSYQPQGDRQLGTLHNSDFVNITFTVFLGI